MSEEIELTEAWVNLDYGANMNRVRFAEPSSKVPIEQRGELLAQLVPSSRVTTLDGEHQIVEVHAPAA
jgi:hypothetical protein